MVNVVNFTYMLDRKARHAARVIAHAIDEDITTVEPTPEAQAQWIEQVRQAGQQRQAYLATCTPGYYNGQGAPARGFFNDVYTRSEIEFWDMIDTWWESGRHEGLTLHSTVGSAAVHRDTIAAR